jgi:hypothetical protein
MGELSIYTNEVRNCRGCYSRIVWPESANRRRCAFNVPDSERVRAGFRQVTRTSTTAPRRNGWSCLREVGDSMHSVRVFISKLLFRLAYWVQPKDIREIKR